MAVVIGGTPQIPQHLLNLYTQYIRKPLTPARTYNTNCRHCVVVASSERNGSGNAEGARNRRRGQHQGGLQVSASQRLRGEGWIQVHR